MTTNSTERFSNRADDYVKYRPGYPPAVVPYLKEHFNLDPDKKIADIGAGQAYQVLFSWMPDMLYGR